MLRLALLSSITSEQFFEKKREFYSFYLTYWREQNYLTPKWWFLVGLSVASLFIWLYFIDKKRMLEITSFGMFYGIGAILLDSIGSNALLWYYPVSLSPYLYPQMYPYDVGIVIIPFMFVYQKWSMNGKKYTLYSGILSAFIAFVCENFMEYLGIYEEILWKNYYSFPIYWFLAILCWVIIRKMKHA